MLIFFIISIVFSGVIYVREKLKGPSLKALLFKVLTTLLIFLYAVFIIQQNPQQLAIGLVVLVALLFGLIGDIVLDLKLIYPKDDSFFTYFGFGSFITGHLFYIGFLLYNFPLSSIEYSFIFGLSGMSVFLVLITEFPLKLNFRKFRTIVAVYSFILSMVMILGFWIGIKFSNSGMIFFGVGMLSFLLSDLILSHSYFGKEEKKWMIIGNYIFYFGAQLILASSIIWI